MRYTPTPRNDPNGLAGLLLSPQMRSLMLQKAEVAQALYRARVAKKTGQLAREVRVQTYIGGKRNDRWCSRVIGQPPREHSAPHEFGARGRPGAHDWPAVLAQMRNS
jgi:hypothetical protein